MNVAARKHGGERVTHQFSGPELALGLISH
jgi:hypothetical protein